MIKYIKSVLWRVAKRLSYIEEAQCLKVNSVYDSDGNIQTTPMNILRTFTIFMKKKYDTLQVDCDSVYRMLQRSKKHVPQSANDALDAAITMDELDILVKQGKDTKHPAVME